MGIDRMKLSPQEFRMEMELCSNMSEESGHSRADHIITQLLIDLGYEEGAKVFDEMVKWYA